MHIKSTEDYRLRVTVGQGRARIRSVLCKIYLPTKHSGPLQLHLFPTNSQSLKLNELFEFKVSGVIRKISGHKSGRIEACKTHLVTAKEDWVGIIRESLALAKPTSLTITEFLSEKKGSSGSEKVTGTFWLTPNIFLSPALSVESSYTGEVKVRSHRTFEFILKSGSRLKFTKHFSYLPGDDDSRMTHQELVAEFETPHRHGFITRIQNKYLPDLDDFLVICSLASRQRCVCVGWSVSALGVFIRHYRRGITIPQSSQSNHNQALVDIRDFKNFVSQAYEKFSSLSAQHQKTIKQAIQYAIPRENSTLENSFITLYSAIETLLSFTARSTVSDNIFPSDEWRKIRSDLKKYLGQHQYLKDDRDRRQLTYEKLSELNRVSFRTAFSRLLKQYPVPLDDLWPVAENSEGVSLSAIRNKLIHGGTVVSHVHGHALTAAREHLGWTAERLLLAFFEWPISQSKVSKEFLSRNRTMYTKWQTDRQVLSNWP